MATSPRPEAIRGAWYRTDPEAEQGDADALPEMFVDFDIDGEFVRYDLEDSSGAVADEGDYTFDGDFLILRGARTRTYRVDCRAPWKWHLQGKKESWDLLRGLYRGDKPRAMSADRRRELERMPQRVLCRRDFEIGEVPSPVTLVDPSEADGELTIGSLFSRRVDDGRLWIVVTPYIQDLDIEFWERVVRGPYLSDVQDGSDGIESADIRIVGLAEERRLTL